MASNAERTAEHVVETVPKRWWYQHSLRTLLVLMVGGGIACLATGAYFVWAGRRLSGFTWSEIRFATCAVSCLTVILVVAFTAFVAKRRLDFFAGTTAALAAWYLTGRLLPCGWSTGGMLDNLDLEATTVLWNAAVCAAVTMTGPHVAHLLRAWHQKRYQYSLWGLFVLVAIVCVVAWALRQLIS